MTILMKNPNFLILDEPTNHLDMATKEMLITALAQYEGTMLFVSHDRHFLAPAAERAIGKVAAAFPAARIVEQQASPPLRRRMIKQRRGLAARHVRHISRQEHQQLPGTINKAITYQPQELRLIQILIHFLVLNLIKAHQIRLLGKVFIRV